MRLALALLVTAVCLRGEFLRIDVVFEDIGCASCLESLEGRLQRVRGVERVEIDAAKGVATLHLDAGNKVRLAPLLSRITQDGTKILRTEAVVLGSVAAGGHGWLLQPSGLAQAYLLDLSGEAAKTKWEAGKVYRMQGVLAARGASDEPVLKVISAVSAAVARQ